MAMPDEQYENESDRKSGLKLFLKIIGLTLVGILALVVIAFGLLVGFCTLGAR
jgi:hypothetical protein